MTGILNDERSWKQSGLPSPCVVVKGNSTGRRLCEPNASLKEESDRVNQGVVILTAEANRLKDDSDVVRTGVNQYTKGTAVVRGYVI